MYDLATRARWHVDAVDEHHAPLVHGSRRSCSVHARAAVLFRATHRDWRV
jgi:hypothetical protein